MTVREDQVAEAVRILDRCLELTQQAQTRFGRLIELLSEADELIERGHRYLSEFGSEDPGTLARQLASWRDRWAAEICEMEARP